MEIEKVEKILHYTAYIIKITGTAICMSLKDLKVKCQVMQNPNKFFNTKTRNILRHLTWKHFFRASNHFS